MRERNRGVQRSGKVESGAKCGPNMLISVDWGGGRGGASREMMKRTKMRMRRRRAVQSHKSERTRKFLRGRPRGTSMLTALAHGEASGRIRRIDTVNAERGHSGKVLSDAGRRNRR